METDRCRDLRPHYAAYAADRTSREHEMRIQLHLSEGCAACAVEIEQLMEAFHALPLGLTPVPPPTPSRQAVMEEVRRTPQEPRDTPVLFPETDRNRLWKVLAALSAVAVVAVAWWGKAQLDEIARLEGEVTRAAMTNTVDARSLERQLGEVRALLGSAASPRARVIDLSAASPAARLFLDRDGGVAILSMESLGAPPDGQLHHVWLVGEDATSLLGRLPPGYSAQGGQVRFRLAPDLQGSRAVISLDPAEPVPTAPGTVVLPPE